MTVSLPEKMLSIFSKPRSKKILIALVILLVAALAFLIWKNGKAEGGTYLSQEVVRGDVFKVITASGFVEAENSVPLIFKNSAVITAIHVKEGQKVKKGDVLAEQDQTDLLASYQQALANLKSAEAKLAMVVNPSTSETIRQSEENANMARLTYEQAGREYERQKSLFSQSAISAADLETAEINFKMAEAKYNVAVEQLKALQKGSRPEEILSAEASVDTAKAQVQIAKNNLDAAKLIAPNDGVIGLVGAVVGQRTNGAGSSSGGEDGFVTLISDTLRVRAQVNEADIGNTAVGQEAYFTVNSYPDQKFYGVVESISTKATTVSNVQLYDVIITLKQQENLLKVGMPASVYIVVAQKSDVLMVPNTAVSYANKFAAQAVAAQAGGGGPRSTAGLGSAARSPGQAGEQGTGAFAGNGPATGQGAGSPGPAGQRAAMGVRPDNPGSAGQGGTGGAGARASGDGRQAAIVVMENGKPVLKQLKIGITDGTNYELIEGLNEGDLVVIGNTADSAEAASSNTRRTNVMMGPPPM